MCSCPIHEVVIEVWYVKRGVDRVCVVQVWRVCVVQVWRVCVVQLWRVCVVQLWRVMVKDV